MSKITLTSLSRLTALFPINHINGTVNEGGINPFKVRVGEDTVSWKVGEVRHKSIIQNTTLNLTVQKLAASNN